MAFDFHTCESGMIIHYSYSLSDLFLIGFTYTMQDARACINFLQKPFSNFIFSWLLLIYQNFFAALINISKFSLDLIYFLDWVGCMSTCMCRISLKPLKSLSKHDDEKYCFFSSKIHILWKFPSIRLVNMILTNNWLEITITIDFDVTNTLQMLRFQRTSGYLFQCIKFSEENVENQTVDLCFISDLVLNKRNRIMTPVWVNEACTY